MVLPQALQCFEAFVLGEVIFEVGMGFQSCAAAWNG